MTELERTDSIKLESSNKAFHTFGYSHIFSKRIKRYLRNLNALKLFGILVPATIGGLAMSYGFNKLLELSIAIAIPITVIQLAISIFAIVYKWEDKLAYAFEAKLDYNALYEEFTKLYKYPPNTYSEIERRFDILTTKETFRQDQNSKYEVSEKELRCGMRYSLREHQKQCSACRLIPTSMQATNCGVCGNF